MLGRECCIGLVAKVTLPFFFYFIFYEEKKNILPLSVNR
jgi:hypothetical protein